MKKIIQNALTIILLPVILAGFLWSAIREAWWQGEGASVILADWFNR